METAAIREQFLSFFEERGHRRMPSASLVPPTYDPSVLLTTAGMQPFKPYFRGEEEPPSPRLTSCQKCFRTPDIEEVGTTARHLTFFEMLGNFSVGDYFKDQAVRYALELVHRGLRPGRGGHLDHGLRRRRGAWASGADEEAIEHWRAVGIPDERIVLLGRGDNWWQAGPTGPCGPCSELYLDRGLEFGGPDDRPGDDTDRFLEYLEPGLHAVRAARRRLPDRPARPRTSTPAWAWSAWRRSFRTCRRCSTPTASGRWWRSARSCRGTATARASPSRARLRILSDHGRGAAFMMADGVVPSNEDRGYVLRRIMRRAIQQGKVLGIDDAFLPALFERVIETVGDAYPELAAQRDTIMRWARSEEEGFGRTLEQGQRLLGDLVVRAREEETSWVSAEDAFRLHDTYGFPFEMTRELLAEEGLSVDDQGFEELMDRAREIARAGGGRSAAATGGQHERVLAFARAAEPSRFRGYESTELETVVSAVEQVNGLVLVKLEESPFYAEGGGQVADRGRVETPSGCGSGDRRLPRGRRPGAGARGGAGRDRPGGDRPGRGGPQPAAGDHAQPHRHPPAPRGAARAAGHARAPGGLVRRPRQAEIRLHPRRAAEPGGARGRGAPHRGVDRRRPPGARGGDHSRRGRAAGRDGPVRREVRRLGADGRGRRRLARAVRWDPRGDHGRGGRCST